MSILLLMLACTPPAAEPIGLPPSKPAAVVPSADADAFARARAREAGVGFAGALRAAMQQAVAAGGPQAGIEVCQVDAPRLAAEAMSRQGVALGRSSLRLRNPSNVGPDWVAARLAEWGERPASGLEVMLEYADTADGRVARFSAPIVVEAACLGCHGPKDTLGPEVQAVLAERYPADQATGYALGDLRGVLWVEARVEGTRDRAAAPAEPAPPG